MIDCELSEVEGVVYFVCVCWLANRVCQTEFGNTLIGCKLREGKADYVLRDATSHSLPTMRLEGWSVLSPPCKRQEGQSGLRPKGHNLTFTISNALRGNWVLSPPSAVCCTGTLAEPLESVACPNWNLNKCYINKCLAEVRNLQFKPFIITKQLNQRQINVLTSNFSPSNCCLSVVL